jgi:hypothetical protein
MPRKSRRSKRRIDPFTEAEAWACAFHCQHDFFGDLAEFGLTDDKAVLEAMPDAWARLGGLFLHRAMGAGFNGEPFALTEYGEPPCR